MPPNGTTEEQNQILENLVSQGYDGIAVSVIAPKDQVGVLNKVGREDATSSPSTPTPPKSQPPALHRHQQLRGRQGAGRARSSSCCPRAARSPSSSARLSADNAAQRLKGIEDAIAGHNIEIVDEARGQHRPRQGPHQRRGHHQRPRRPEPGRAASGRTTVRRSPPRSRRSARRARCWRPCSTRRTARSTASRRHDRRCTVVQKPFQFGYLSAQVDARAGHQGRGGKAADPAGQGRSTPASRCINKDNVADFRDASSPS